MEKYLIFICTSLMFSVKNSDKNPYIVHRWQLWEIERKTDLPFDKALDLAKKESLEQEKKQKEKIERLKQIKNNPVNSYTEEYRKQAKLYSEEQEMKRINEYISQYLKNSPENYWNSFENPNYANPETKKNEPQTLEQKISDIFDCNKIRRPYAQRPSSFPHLKREPDTFGMKPITAIKFTAPRWKKLQKVNYQPRTIFHILKPISRHSSVVGIGPQLRKEQPASSSTPTNFSDIDGFDSTFSRPNKKTQSTSQRPNWWLYN